MSTARSLAADEYEVNSSGKMDISHLDTVLENICNITNNAEAKKIKADEQSVTGIELAVFCFDCRKIVTGTMGKGRRGKERIICGQCKSCKIAQGRAEALRTYYHLPEEKIDEEETPAIRDDKKATKN